MKIRLLLLIFAMMITTGCPRGFDAFLAPRVRKQCEPLIAQNDIVAYGEYELARVHRGWDVWIGDKIKNAELTDLKIKYFVHNISPVPVYIRWYPQERKKVLPNEKIELYAGVMNAVIGGLGVGGKHFNIRVDHDVKTIKFSISIEFENTLKQPYIEIPVTATYSSNI